MAQDEHHYQQGLFTVCYSKKCPMAIGLQKLFDQLNTRESHILQYKYNSLKCGQICWAIYDVSRSFFAVPLLPQDFERDSVEFPVCTLGDIGADLKFQHEVYRSTFPPSWEKRLQAEAERESKEHGDDSKSEKKNTAVKRTAFQEFFTPGAEEKPSTEGGIKQLHPKFQQALKKYHEMNGGAINIGQIMDLARIQLKELPCLKGHWNTKSRKCLTCWPHMLGGCSSVIGVILQSSM
jgi:hypothetical protein